MNEENEGTFKELIIPSLFGVGISFAVLLISVLCFSFAAYFTGDPKSTVTVAAISSLCLSSVSAGAFGAKKSENFIGGVISGAVSALILFLLSLIFGGEDIPYSYLYRIGYVTISSISALVFAKAGGGVAKLRRGAVKTPKLKRIKIK